MSGQTFGDKEAFEQLKKSFQRVDAELKDNIYRRLAKKSFQCATKCCINSEVGALDSCIGDCTQPMVQYKQLVQHEVQIFQERLQRCQMNCNEEAQDRVPHSDRAKLSSSARSELQGEFAVCNEKCFLLFREKSNDIMWLGHVTFLA